MSATIADIRGRLPLEALEDPQITPHLRRAVRDFDGKVFEGDDGGFDEVEAIACKAIYYLAPLLWLKIQQKVNEYDETLQTFGDVEKFQTYWLDRSESVSYTDETSGEVNMGGVSCRVV